MKNIFVIIAVVTILFLAYAFIKDSAAASLNILNMAVSFSSNTKIEKEIVFDASKDLELDIYVGTQNDLSAEQARPVIVFFYGGGWSWGDKRYFEFVAQSFVQKGYIVVIPNYTLYPKAKYPEFVKDGAKAVVWVKNNIKNYKGDANNIHLVGHSAGAYIGAMIAFNNDYLADLNESNTIIKAFAGVAGPYNFTPKAQEYIDIFGEDNFVNMKVMNHVTRNEPPSLLIHGEGDTTVGTFNQTLMAASLQGNTSRVQTILYGPEITHVKALLKLHPWFAGKVNVGADIDQFFKTLTPIDN